MVLMLTKSSPDGDLPNDMFGMLTGNRLSNSLCDARFRKSKLMDGFI